MQTKRGFIDTILDRLVARQLGIPSETCSYTVTGIRIPAPGRHERFEFAADLYNPVLASNKKPAGTILIRCPYGRSLLFAILSARPYAARGYQCLLVSCRGTFGSGAEFVPWHNEEEDGQAVVTWMRAQSWYTGSFATMGGSYLGFVQWALLQNPPSDMVAAVIQCSPHDFSKQLWGTGSLALDWVSWAENILNQEKTGMVQFLRRWSTPKRIRPVLNQTPLATSLKLYFQDRAPWLNYVVEHPDTSDQFYDQLKLGEALERANIPVFLVGGWYDVFAPQTIEQYTRLSERNVDVALLVGPWNHTQVGLQSKVHHQSFNWLEEHLGNRGHRACKAAVQYYLTGAEEWREVPRWPPPTLAKELYLQPGNRPASNQPAIDTSSKFLFNVRQPTPTMGGNLLLEGGSVDDTALTLRADVLSFATETLENSVEISGKVVLQLAHSSDNSVASMFVRVSELNSKGQSRNITETYKCLEASRIAMSHTLYLNDCAHRFSKGNRINLLIAGASFPQFAITTQKGVTPASSEVTRIAHTIYHGPLRVSKIILPIAQDTSNAQT